MEIHLLHGERKIKKTKKLSRNFTCPALKSLDVESFIDGGDLYHVEDKVEAIINKVLGLIDFPYPLGDSGLYIDGVFYSDII